MDGKSVGSYDGDTLPSLEDGDSVDWIDGPGELNDVVFVFNSILGTFVGLCIGVGAGIVEDMFESPCGPGENALPDGRNVGTELVKFM